MIKDAILHLATSIKSDSTIAYAVLLAQAFEAHLAGVAFAYEAVPPRHADRRRAAGPDR